MLYAKRTVRCSARNLSRQAAKQSLEGSGQFAEGTEVLDIRRRGDMWVATLLEPKTAEFPPPKDDDNDSESAPPEKEKSDSDSGSDDGPKEKSSDGESGGPPKPAEPKGEKAELSALMDLVSQIADKLGIVPGPAVPGAEDNPMPDGPPAPPPGPPAPPGGAPGGLGGPGHQEVVHRTKLRPGETPPGVTPVGSPAFASVNGAQLARMASFDAFDDTPNKSIKEAKTELEALYGPHGFKVRQIKRVEGGKRLAAKLSRK